MTSPPPGTLPARFGAHLRGRDWLGEGERVVVAWSGGLDSSVLLHLLRFGREGGDVPSVEVCAAHFDHRMREESGDDARRVAALGEAWDVEVSVGRADPVPRGETEARLARYRFLEEERTRLGARWVLTAHHADDQAETLLFRIFRGTGLRGLAGIPEARDPGILRPLLPFRRAELAAYAREAGIEPLSDPMNRDLRVPRNVIRHEILPRAEEGVAPGARGALLRLGRLALQSEEAWQSVLPELTAGVVTGEEEGRILLSRERFLALHPHVAGRLLRALLGRLGTTLDEAGTDAALAFTRSGASGRAWRLSGKVVLIREFDRLVLSEEDVSHAEASEPRDDPLVLEGDAGSGPFRVGGRRMVARWGPEVPEGARWVEPFLPSRLRFPLSLRGWLPGDRIRTPAGTRKLKKVFSDARVPVRERHRIPLLHDAAGEILWVAGVARSPDPEGTEREPEDGGTKFAEEPLYIGIEEFEDADGE